MIHCYSSIFLDSLSFFFIIMFAFVFFFVCTVFDEIMKSVVD